jgi:hypothetical protein
MFILNKALGLLITIRVLFCGVSGRALWPGAQCYMPKSRKEDMIWRFWTTFVVSAFKTCDIFYFPEVGYMYVNKKLDLSLHSLVKRPES